MKCRACRQKLTGDSRFCPACGQPSEPEPKPRLSPAVAALCLLLLLALPLAAYALWFAPPSTAEAPDTVSDYADVPLAGAPQQQFTLSGLEDNLRFEEAYLAASGAFFAWQDSSYSDSEALYDCIVSIFRCADAFGLTPEPSGLSLVLDEEVLREFLSEAAGFDYPYLPVVSWLDLSYRDGRYYWKDDGAVPPSCSIYTATPMRGGALVRFCVFPEDGGAYSAEAVLADNIQYLYCPYVVTGYERIEPDAGQDWISPQEVGKPAVLTLDFGLPRTVFGVELTNGARETEVGYDRYARAKTVILEFSDGSRVRYEFPDAPFAEARSVYVALPAPVMTEYVTITVTDIYPGLVSNRVALSNVRTF